jgi:hypothetical protein
MPESLTGKLSGRIITLDESVPPLDGRRVRVVLRPIEETDGELSSAVEAEAWEAWVERGPQGPIDDEGNPEFP